MSKLTRVAVIGGIGLAVLLAVVLYRATLLDSQQVEAEPVTELPIDTTAAAERLGGAIQFPTISDRNPAGFDSTAFLELHDYLEDTFPGVHAQLTREVVNDMGLLYTWEGEDPSRPPIVLMAHTDVVPIDSEEVWTYPPFSGAVEEGFVWGRGALDDKASAVGILEAVEYLIDEGYVPDRTVYIALGHDEEVGGQYGARPMASMIAERGPEPAFVIDEGGAIIEEAVPFTDKPAAMIGVAEKGFLSVKITVEQEGGHSALPERPTSVEQLKDALVQLREDPLPARLGGTGSMTFQYLAPELGIVPRAVFANLWLTRPLVEYALARDEVTESIIRTTHVTTELDAGVKDNVVPSAAQAVVNFRLMPGDGPDDVIDHLRDVMEDIPVTLEILQAGPPSSVSPIEGDSYEVLKQTIQQVTPDDVLTAPYLVAGATDARHYAPYTDRIYRFLPFRLSPDDANRIHGTDERIALEDHAAVIAFYIQLLRNLPEALANE